METVAPLAGSVDRNQVQPNTSPLSAVAPLAGSVDRNGWRRWDDLSGKTSLPSRGAWIEIYIDFI